MPLFKGILRNLCRHVGTFRLLIFHLRQKCPKSLFKQMVIIYSVRTRLIRNGAISLEKAQKSFGILLDLHYLCTNNT